MSLSVPFVVCILSTFVWITVSTAKVTVEIEDSITGDIDDRRVKRTATVVGAKSFKAIKSLIDGAVEVKNKGKVRKYFKTGNYVQAAKDFISVYPADRKVFKLPGGHRGMMGKIGDKEITLRPSWKDGNPVIEIRDASYGDNMGDLTHKIKYSGKNL